MSTSVTDIFAGAGGSLTGVTSVRGVHVDMAVNVSSCLSGSDFACPLRSDAAAGDDLAVTPSATKAGPSRRPSPSTEVPAIELD